ncbi:SDR family NAD(P)-dependent oxidoreductase [Frondihabitans australicus]|uniref:Short subunit dehydrogenase n=1 Tax=Frondihabitans australicus TaxID=386892 RepID=A0A495IJM7_9MICO|nr:SDR family NAD(P)-dependent oxidoreductase [Frondihabitans australicus]RKR75336.1 short subunit dehydrogenase [Frondihabitans australicus]
MTSTFVIVGYGPGISHAVAERAGADGHRLALVGRTESRLGEGVAALAQAGIDAAAYPADASDPASLGEALARITADAESVAGVLWTAFRGGNVTDVLAADPATLGDVFGVGVRGLLTTVQALREPLVASGGVVLVANGALGEASEQMDAVSQMLGADGTALECAAKSKLVGLLAERLRGDGVYVGQITVAGSVSGTATASPTAISAASIAEQFWSMASERSETRTRIAE